MTTKQPILAVKGLKKQVGDHALTILDDINLTFYAGEMVAIVGQSGSGKSTLMNILGCLDQATAGDYTLFGRSVQDLDADALAKVRREHFGFIFQRYHLLNDISALDNVCVPAIYKGVPHKIRQQRAAHLLDKLGLAGKHDNKPSELSGGQQQRVSIARALMNGGEVILADEPTGALDSASGHEVMKILHELNREGHTVILVTHDPNLAQQAERIITLKDGKVIDDTYIDQKTKTATPIFEPPSRSLPIDRLKEALKMSLHAMKAHKMRTLLTMLGIIIGIASVVSIVGLGKGTQDKILSSINELGTNTITVIDGYPFGDPRRKFGVDTLSIADSEAVAAQPYVLGVSPQVDANILARHKNIETNASINGVGQDYLAITGEKMQQGKSFDKHQIKTLAQDIILDQNAYKAFFGGVGDPVGQVILVGHVPAQVVGVLADKDKTFGRSNGTPKLYMPYTTVMGRILNTAYLDEFVVRIDDNTPTAAAEAAIKKLLTTRHGTDDFDTFSSDGIRQTVAATTSAMTLLISSIAIISLIVGGIGVMNIMLVSVTERTSEIGVRMAVGARQSDIRQQFLIEAVLVCLLGGTLGIVFAFAIGAVINSLGSEDFAVVYSPTALLSAVLCSTFIGVVFGFLPAKNAAKLSPVEALSR